MRRAVVTAIFLLLCGTRADAQTVLGHVLDANGQAVAFTTVVLADEDGATVRSIVSRADGSYSIPAGRPGRFRLRVERPGGIPHATELFDLVEDETRSMQITTSVVPVRVEGVLADVSRRCSVEPQDGLAIAGFWERAKSALQLVAAIDPLEGLSGMRAVHYLRELDRSGTRQLGVNAMHEFDASSRVPFSALPDRSLAILGFAAVAQDREFAFFGPSPTAIFADAFVDSHCFSRILLGSGGSVGLGFEPAQPTGRAGIGIGGIIWLDGESLDVRIIEYDYRDPATTRPNGARGRIEMTRLANGAPTVASWWIRLPSRLELPPPNAPGRRAETLALFEEGGILLDASGRPVDPDAAEILSAMGTALTPEGDLPRTLPLADATMAIRSIPQETYTVGEPVILASNSILTLAEIEESFATVNSVADMLVRRFSSLMAVGNQVVVRAFYGSCAGPHYVINGVPSAADSALGLNPRDIANVRLLRYGGETAWYGFLGACGVIEITTR